MSDKACAEATLSDHVARFWRILQTEHVRILVDMKRGSDGIHYFDSASFGDDVAKALVAERESALASLPSDDEVGRVCERLEFHARDLAMNDFPKAAASIREAAALLQSQAAELAAAWAEFGDVPRDRSLAAHIKAALDELAQIAADERARAERAEAALAEKDKALEREPTGEMMELLPCPFCGGAMQHREALWPSEGDTDGIIHASPTDCPLPEFSTGTADRCETVTEAWNRRAHSKDGGEHV